MVLLCIFAIVMVVAILWVEHRLTRDQYVQNTDRYRKGFFEIGNGRDHKARKW